MNRERTTEENKDMEIIKHTTKTSKAFNTGIDPIHLLEKLDGYMEVLTNNPSEKDVQGIKNELESMEIITLTYGEERWWINEALVLHKYVMKRPMAKRISHLFKTRGEWRSEHVKKDNIEVKSRVHLPIHVIIQPQADIDTENNDANKLTFAIKGIHHSIEEMLENGDSSCGVFLKPYGVIHMNRLSMWLEENETYGHWSMKDELRTMSLYEIAKETVIETRL
ncbi:hypothetical protein [Evansella clarkii]|uniref:hypothetical protein n=1 Tax=Evansella clarkii TaxID=79879 RepID=UPI00099886E4|nr:hypothetical protein [Evansella clarkii]